MGNFTLIPIQMTIPSRQQLTDAFRSPMAERLSPMARERLRWITYFVERQCTVTETCERFGIARATFHRWLERFDVRNLSSLEDHPTEHAPRSPAVSEEIITLIRAYRQAAPLMGKEQISHLLATEHGHTVSSSTVGRIIERECFYFASTPLHWRKRQRLEDRQHDGKSDVSCLDAAPLVSVASCTCGWCRFRRVYWPMLRRHIALASVFTHIAILGLFAFMVLWEQFHTEERHSLPATVIDLSIL